MGIRKKSIFDDLCDALTKELQIYEELLDAMKMKQNAIIKGENDKIKDAIHQEREASQNILKQMEMRNELTQSISSKSDIRDKKITLTKKETRSHIMYSFINRGYTSELNLHSCCEKGKSKSLSWCNFII